MQKSIPNFYEKTNSENNVQIERGIALDNQIVSIVSIISDYQIYFVHFSLETQSVLATYDHVGLTVAEDTEDYTIYGQKEADSYTGLIVFKNLTFNKICEFVGTFQITNKALHGKGVARKYSKTHRFYLCKSTFANSKMQKTACIIYDNGDSYHGDVVNDQYEGCGVCRIGALTYSGAFAAHRFHGFGEESARSYQTRGFYESGKKCGFCVVEAENGRFLGGYLNDLKEGYGELQQRSGEYYRGFWRKGKRQGFGVGGDLLNGEEAGVWENDVLVKVYSDEAEIQKLQDALQVEANALQLTFEAGETHHRLLQEQLQRRRLERTVAKLTRQLANSQLSLSAQFDSFANTNRSLSLDELEGSGVGLQTEREAGISLLADKVEQKIEKKSLVQNVVINLRGRGMVYFVFYLTLIIAVFIQAVLQ